MTRGNQRDKAREKNLKEQAAKKAKNGMSGSQQAAQKLKTDQIMQEKQKKAAEKKAQEEADKLAASRSANYR